LTGDFLGKTPAIKMRRSRRKHSERGIHSARFPQTPQERPLCTKKRGIAGLLLFFHPFKKPYLRFLISNRFAR